MTEERDIYKTPPKTNYPPVNAPVPAPPSGVKPPHYMAIAVLTGMVVLMAAVAYFFFPAEDEELETPAPSGFALRPAAGTTPDTDKSAEAVAIETLLADVTSSQQAAPSSLSPQKMAEAMGYVRAAQAEVRKRDFDAAETEIGKALAVWPDMNLAIRLLGSIYTQRGQFDQAIRLFERSLEIEPFSAETLNNLGINYMQKGMIAKAEEQFMTSLQIRPDYAVANLNLGFLQLRLGRFDLAAANFELGLQSFPGNPGVLNNLAVCYIRLGDLTQAREKLQLLIDQDPGRQASYFNMAISYIVDQDLDTAVTWVRRGADLCTPSQLQMYLADPDLNPIRQHPGYKQLVSDRFPEIPARGPLR